MLFNVTNEVGKSTLDERGYVAAWHTVPHVAATDKLVYSSQAPPNMTTQQRQTAFGFCATPWGNCSLIMMRSTNGWAATERLYSINSNYVQMPNSSCNFEIVSSGAFDRLKTSAPVPLQEKYYVCTSSDQNALYTAAGTAFGNTAIAVSVAITLFVHVLLIVQYSSGVFLPRTYMQEEKQEILDGIATKLLVLRDARHKEEHDDQHSLLTTFLNELQQTHEQDNVYFVRQKTPAEEARRQRADHNWTKTLQMVGFSVNNNINVNNNKKQDDEADEATAARAQSYPKLSIAGEMGQNPMHMSELAHKHLPAILELGRLRTKSGTGQGGGAGATELDEIPLPPPQRL